MGLQELSQGELFLIEAIREFQFLFANNYTGSAFVIAGREYCVTFTNKLVSKSITIIWQETQDLNVIFNKKTFWKNTTIDLVSLGRKKLPTSLKTLSKIIQTNYMYLIV